MGGGRECRRPHGLGAKVSWPRPLGAIACAGLLAAAALPGVAAPITPVAPTGAEPPTGPAPELLAAYRVLDRLMATAAIEAPITLVVRPFRAATCPPPTPPAPADPAAVIPPEAPEPPVATGPPEAPGPPSAPAGICLNSLQLPPRLRQGFFVPFVASLQRQSDPEHDPEQLSAAIEGRTILLNASGLDPVPPPSPAGARPTPQPGASLQPAAVCRVAEAFAAVQLDQPRQRRESFDRIHARLAERIHRIRAPVKTGRSFVDVLAFHLATTAWWMYYGVPYGVLGYIEGIHHRNLGRWVNARLAESPHWQVLQTQAPMVAAALTELRGLPERALIAPDGPPQTTVFASEETTFSQAWRRIDGWFGIAAQEREQLIQAQRLEAQAEARRRLAAAGLDPTVCAAVFLPPSAALPEAAAEPEAAALSPVEQAGGQVLPAGPVLPHRFLPGGQAVMIFPRPAER